MALGFERTRSRSLLWPGIMLPDASPGEPSLSSFETALRAALDSHRTTATTTTGGSAPIERTGGAQIVVNSANLSLHVGAAATLGDLSRHLTDHGITCAAIPAGAAERTMGELIADPSSAERVALRHNLLGVDVVLPDGRAHARFGGQNMKDVAGYDAKRLFIGSRNAFGAISAATFKITVST